jgi:hypothetical protein
VEPLKTRSFYYGLSTYGHRIQAVFPPRGHQKDGPANCLPVWHLKSRGNPKKYSKVPPRRVPKSPLKSIQIQIWAPRCLLGAHVDPWIAKVVTQSGKMEPRGPQNDSFGYKNDPFQQAATQQYCLIPELGGTVGKHCTV